MNKFKQTKAVAECRVLRGTGRCPRLCMHWNRKGQPFCKDAYAAERHK